jgi:hypothetical protein
MMITRAIWCTISRAICMQIAYAIWCPTWITFYHFFTNRRCDLMCNLVSAVANTEQRKCNRIWNHALNCTQNCTCYQPRTLEVDGGLYWHRLPLFQHEIICLLYAIFVSITFFSLFPFRLLTLLRSYVTFLVRAISSLCSFSLFIALLKTKI